ncbi:BT_3928 family protein [uncultured Bacteroides sp.]|uniref:BT_3928 family protein n=1 Tax=uncultured Bacteroides sp. TaxID=162156 RepID=UPI002AA64E2F|nr:BT_3928 family protein [uncultured Bacteroides sp.]
METKIQHSRTLNVWVNLCRLILSIVFVFSGFVKAVDPLGSAYKIRDYAEAFGLSSLVPGFMPLFLAVFLSTLEFSMGGYLFFGIRKKISTSLTLLMMLFMTPLTLYLAIKNPVSDCGCFGDALVLTNWQTFGKNVVLLIASVSCFIWKGRIWRLVSEKTQWLVALYVVSFGLILSIYCYNNLPIIDFRPYRIGNSIPEGMSIPDGAKRNVYENTFILEKNGVKKDFSLENYPDSTWKFIETKTVLKEKGYEPPIHDFSITEAETGADITKKVLNDKGYTFLLIAHRIEEADDNDIDLINEIYDYSVENGYAFYCLTSSLDEQIEQWKSKTGAEYPFCFTDDITLKTIIRSNPGLVLIKNGVILNKWHHSDLPDEYALSGKLDKLNIGKQKTVDDKRTIVLVVFWFLIPLLLVLGLDILVIKRLDKKKKRTLINPLINKKMRKNIVAGNWKMNMTLAEGLALAKELNEVLAAEKPNCDVVIGTPFIHLASVAAAIDTNKIGVAAQNCADKVSGAYTGEVSAAMVASTGAKYVILGHSERRAYYHETAEILKEKVVLALANGLTPIFCIGEVLEEREAGKQNEVVSSQLAGSLFDLSAEDFSKIILAYEPVWAIGTGKTASAEQAQEIHAYIRSTIVAKYGKEVAENTSILYGGSCKASNAKELFANTDVDGGLIGGASLKAADFKGIIDAFNA